MEDCRDHLFMHAFILGWTKHWSPVVTTDNHYDDLFRSTLMTCTEGKVREQYNRKVAELFGEVVTKVKTFPTPNGWIILDKHTKRLLHKDVKNENEVDLLCKTQGYLR